MEAHGTFGGSKSMRENYRHGPQAYYSAHGGAYRNPHFPQIVKCVAAALDALAPSLQRPLGAVLDLACGSGEATLALLKYFGVKDGGDARGRAGGREGASEGAGEGREEGGSEAGEAGTREEGGEGPRLPAITAADPFTGAAFLERTGRVAEPWGFEQVQEGILTDLGLDFDLTIISFAAHLIPEQRLFSTLFALSLASRHLLILSPHKRPPVLPKMGWEEQAHLVIERVHARLFVSLSLQ